MEVLPSTPAHAVPKKPLSPYAQLGEAGAHALCCNCQTRNWWAPAKGRRGGQAMISLATLTRVLTVAMLVALVLQFDVIPGI